MEDIKLHIETPKIEGLLDKELEDKINKDFKDNANALILAFESDMKELKEQFPDEEVNLGIDSGYIVRTDNESILAIDSLYGKYRWFIINNT